jgi:hypothetical protein
MVSEEAIRDFESLIGLKLPLFPIVNYVIPSEIGTFAYCPRRPFVSFYYIKIKKEDIPVPIDIKTGIDIHKEVYAGIPVSKSYVVDNLSKNGSIDIYEPKIFSFYDSDFGKVLLVGRPDSVSVRYNFKVNKLLFDVEELKSKNSKNFYLLNSRNIMFADHLQASVYCFMIDSYEHLAVGSLTLRFINRDNPREEKIINKPAMRSDTIVRNINEFLFTMYSNKVPDGPFYADRCDVCVFKDKCKSMSDKDIVDIVNEVKNYREEICKQSV